MYLSLTLVGDNDGGGDAPNFTTFLAVPIHSYRFLADS